MALLRHSFFQSVSLYDERHVTLRVCFTACLCLVLDVEWCCTKGDISLTRKGAFHRKQEEQFFKYVTNLYSVPSKYFEGSEVQGEILRLNIPLHQHLWALELDHL